MSGVRRGMAVAALVAGLAVAGVAGAPPASAHPLGNFTVNRYSGIELSPGRVSITYVLDLAEIPAFQTLPDVDTDGDGTPGPEERRAWAGRTASELLEGVALSVDGRPVALRLEDASMRLLPGQGGLDVIHLRARFAGPMPRSGRAEYRDGNFADRIGWREITVRSDEGVSVAGADVPRRSVSGELRRYPSDLLSSPLDVDRATFSFRPGTGSGVVPGTGESGTVAPGGGGFAALVTWRLTPGVLALSLLAAFAFGALHALGPGHGKTVMAAYLVGTDARLGQALAVGGAVTLMHTASVLGLGLVALWAARVFPPERVYPWLGLAAGLVILGLGTGLLVARARADRSGWDLLHAHDLRHGHDHLPAPVTLGLPVAPAQAESAPSARAESRAPLRAASSGTGSTMVADERILVLDEGPRPERPRPGPHHPHPANGHRHEPPPGPALSGRRLAALAVSGGMLPSPTALVVLLGAVSLHRVGYGLALIAAFSLGLACALMAVGVAALRARSFLAARMSWRPGAWIPLASAAVVVAVGAVLTVRAVLQLA